MDPKRAPASPGDNVEDAQPASAQPTSGDRPSSEVALAVAAECWRRFADGQPIACPSDCGGHVAVRVHEAMVYRLCCVLCAWRSDWFVCVGDHLHIVAGFDDPDADGGDWW